VGDENKYDLAIKKKERKGETRKKATNGLI
jgi:hypothetical protein